MIVCFAAAVAIRGGFFFEMFAWPPCAGLDFAVEVACLFHTVVCRPSLTTIPPPPPPRLSTTGAQVDTLDLNTHVRTIENTAVVRAMCWNEAAETILVGLRSSEIYEVNDKNKGVVLHTAGATLLPARIFFPLFFCVCVCVCVCGCLCGHMVVVFAWFVGHSSLCCC